jgi:hypothetical protein
MVRLKILAVIILFGFADRACALNLAEWKYQAEITVEDGNAEYCKLLITPEIYNAARFGLGDIRLVGPDGSQVPYIVYKPRDEKEKEEYNPTIINRSTGKNKAAVVTLDFGRQEIKNSIEVVTEGSSFRRAVKVEGSNDNVEFYTLVEKAYIFAVGSEKDRRFEQIDLPKNDYRYLRVTVEPMAGEEVKTVIDEVKTFKTEENFTQRQPVKMVLSEHKENAKEKTSSYVYDLSYCRLPISEIELDVADESFYRCVTVKSRDKNKQEVKIETEDNRQLFKEVEVPWEKVICDTIYRYKKPDGKKAEKLVLRIPENRQAYRYLKIEISNYDDEPVVMNSALAKMIAHNLIFTPKNFRKLTLYVGSESASTPQYDLKYRIENPMYVKSAEAKLGSLIINQISKKARTEQVAWTEKHKVLLLVIMGAMVVVLGWFMLKSLKTIQKEQSQD